MVLLSVVSRPTAAATGWDPFRRENFCITPTRQNQKLKLGSSNIYFNEPSRWFWCMLKLREPLLKWLYLRNYCCLQKYYFFFFQLLQFGKYMLYECYFTISVFTPIICKWLAQARYPMEENPTQCAYQVIVIYLLGNLFYLIDYRIMKF